MRFSTQLLLFRAAAPMWAFRSFSATVLAHPTRYQRAAVIALLVTGGLLRLLHFTYDRSFFIDELYLNINLVTLSLKQLATGPLQYEQKAPLGYLWTVKLLVMALGSSQQVLRLFSLLCGLTSLAVLVPVARYFLRGWGVVAAVAILALSGPCVYHAVEAKQYSAELLATLLALWLYVRYHADTTRRGQLRWGLGGAVLLWFSFPLIFVLAGMAGALGTAALGRGRWRQVQRYLLPFGLWLLSFGLQYLLFVGKYPQSGWLIAFFDHQYQAFPPASLAGVGWLVHKMYLLTQHPLGLLLRAPEVEFLQSSAWRLVLKLGWLHLGFLVTGTVLLLRADRLHGAVLVLPLLLTLLAAGLRIYPFYERFTLFLAPLLILLTAYGLERGLRAVPGQLAPILLAVLCFAPAVYNSSAQALYPAQIMNREYNREILFYVNERFRPGDVVYVFWNMRHAYGFYKAAYGLRYKAVQGSFVKNAAVSPSDYLRRLQPDFARLRGAGRVWFIYDHMNRDAIGDYVGQPAWYHEPAFKPSQLLEQQFARRGRCLDFYQHYPHTVRLYQWRQPLQ